MDSELVPACVQITLLRAIRLLDSSVKRSEDYSVRVVLPLEEMTVSEKIGIMEEIWSDLSRAKEGYLPPDWHDRILGERARLAESGEVGFTDWETAKWQIKDRVS